MTKYLNNMKSLMNIMKFKTSLKESLLSNIDDTMDKGDFYMNIYKKAEADWNKLLDGKGESQKYTSNIWVLSIKSPELVTYLSGDLKPKNKPDRIRLFINIYDALGSNLLKDKRVSIHLAKNYKAEVITNIPYNLPWKDHNDFNLVTDKATVKEMIDVVINNLKEYLQFDNIDVVKELIKQNSII